MYDWELDAVRAHRAVDWKTVEQKDLDRDKAKRREVLEKIFEKYCEVGRAAKRLKGKGWSAQIPPTYDPEKEIIVSVGVKGTKVVVETKQTTGWRFNKRYELVERKGEWKIRDNSKYSADASATWEADIL